MRKYSLFCDCCGKEVENLYTINFKAAEGSEGDDYYLPDIEICEDCIEETCGLLKEWLTSPDVIVEDKDNEEVENNNENDKMADKSYSNYPDVDCHIPAAVCDTYEDCAVCPYNDDTNKTNIPDLKDCNELENGETPIGGHNFNEVLENLTNLTNQFYNATSAPAQDTTSKEPSNFQFELTEDDVYEAVELSRVNSNINLNITESTRKTIFHTIYNFSKKDYSNDEQYKNELHNYLDSLKSEDERKYALLCSYGMAACDRVTTLAMPILGLMGLAL